MERSSKILKQNQTSTQEPGETRRQEEVVEDLVIHSKHENSKDTTFLRKSLRETREANEFCVLYFRMARKKMEEVRQHAMTTDCPWWTRKRMVLKDDSNKVDGISRSGRKDEILLLWGSRIYTHYVFQWKIRVSSEKSCLPYRIVLKKIKKWLAFCSHGGVDRKNGEVVSREVVQNIWQIRKDILLCNYFTTYPNLLWFDFQSMEHIFAPRFLLYSLTRVTECTQTKNWTSGSQDEHYPRATITHLFYFREILSWPHKRSKIWQPTFRIIIWMNPRSRQSKTLLHQNSHHTHHQRKRL